MAAYQSSMGTSTKTAEKKFPIKIVVIVLAVSALVVTAILALGKGSNKNYENVVEQYLDAGYSHNGEKFLSLFPNVLVDEIYRRSGATKEDVQEYYSDMLSKRIGQPSFYRVQDGDKWSFSFEITECYDYDDYEVQSYEKIYQKHGINLEIDAAKAVHYSLRLTCNDMERDIGTCILNLIQVSGSWYVNDYLDTSIFFWESFENDGVRDFSVINTQKEEKEDKVFIAEYLGCSIDKLYTTTGELQDGKQQLMFRYMYPNGSGSYFLLYVSGEGNNTRVMAYYPWTASPTYEAYSIPVEELPADERDNNWKITFTNAEQQQVPQGIETIESDNNIISAFPDGDESKTPVIYYDTDILDISEEDEKSLAAGQRPALIQYLGCSEDNLWAGYVICTQGDVPKIGFWYVDDYEEISDDFIILLEDGTVAWCDDDISYEHSAEGTRITGTMSIRTIDRYTFHTEKTAGNLIDARKLSESEQKNLIAEYLGCSVTELTYYQTNQAQRMEFESTNDEIYGLVFLLDDGTVAQHNDGEPPYREEGVGHSYAGGHTLKYSVFMGDFTSALYSGNANLSISEVDGALTFAYYDYAGDSVESFSDVFYSPYDGLEMKAGEVNNSYDVELLYSKDSRKVTLEYTPAEKSTYRKDTIVLTWYENGSFHGIDFSVRDAN